jgi:hypothetical protein
VGPAHFRQGGIEDFSDSDEPRDAARLLGHVEVMAESDLELPPRLDRPQRG